MNPNVALTTPLTPSVGNTLSIPHTLEGQISKPRKPKCDNKYILSLFCPCIPASEHLQCWTSPHAISHHNNITSCLPISATSTLLQVMLLSLEEKTRSNYGASLLCFTQFCNSHNISAFIALYTGLRSSDCINRWLSGIKWWHMFQGAEWNSRDMLTTVTKGIAKLVPTSPWQDKWEPITLECMHCLLHGLDLSNAKDTAIYAASSVTFYGICRIANANFLSLSLTFV